MNQETFDNVRRRVQTDIGEQVKKLNPDEPVMAISVMQRDAGMQGYIQRELDDREVTRRSAVGNYIAGANLALGIVAEQNHLTYEPISRDV